MPLRNASALHASELCSDTDTWLQTREAMVERNVEGSAAARALIKCCSHSFVSSVMPPMQSKLRMVSGSRRMPANRPVRVPLVVPLFKARRRTLCCSKASLLFKKAVGLLAQSRVALTSFYIFLFLVSVVVGVV